jgi:hypothetical protein
METSGGHEDGVRESVLVCCQKNLRAMVNLLANMGGITLKATRDVMDLFQQPGIVTDLLDPMRDDDPE